MLYKLFRIYRDLPGNIILLFVFEFILSLVHVAFILILNIYLRKQGFSDPEIASFNSLRFIGALAFSLPLGIYIKGKRLKPFFIASSFLVPLTSFLIIESIQYKIVPLIQLSFLLWGLGMMFMRVCSLPFVIRNTTSANSSEALSLNAATWSLATIVSGLIISGLNWINILDIHQMTIVFDEKGILRVITLMGLCSIIFALNIKEENYHNLEKSNPLLSLHKSYDWELIFQAISPLILISIGAGLTIPFVNLFFNSIFGITSSDFSLMGSLTAMLVFFSSLMVPILKKKYGYWFTIVLVQSLAIICLVIMALTEIFAAHTYAIYIAILAFVMRQPLMHMAHPSSNELMMNYVGKRNQELISALSSSLWSASWFISAKIFEWLRLLDYQYYEIFLITSGMYILGVILYISLIRRYEAMHNENDHGVFPIIDELNQD